MSFELRLSTTFIETFMLYANVGPTPAPYQLLSGDFITSEPLWVGLSRLYLKPTFDIKGTPSRA